MKKMVFKKGFTLVELLIVITIIGILAAALLPSILGAPARARDASRKADLNNILTAIETYQNDHMVYPDDDFCISTDGEDTDVGNTDVENTDGGNTDGYLNSYFQGGTPPKDPQGINAKPVLDTCKGYYYCPIKDDPYSNYFVLAKMEVTGSGNIDFSDEEPSACSDVNVDNIQQGGSHFIIVK